MILLGTSLPDLTFQAALPVPGAETAPPVDPVVPAGAPARNDSASPWFLLQGFLALGTFLLLVVFIVTLWRNSKSRQIWALAAGVVVLYALASLLPRWAPQPPAAANEPAPEAQPPSLAMDIAPIGEPPAGLVTLVIVMLALVAAALIAWLLTQAARQTQIADPLAREAEAAVQAIAAGQDLTHVIVRCYLNMESMVAEERGIERKKAVTPREFETYLVKNGIPKNPILQLTRLFEKARYGNLNLNAQDEQEAVSCLSAIQAACRRVERGSR